MQRNSEVAKLRPRAMVSSKLDKNLTAYAVAAGAAGAALLAAPTAAAEILYTPAHSALRGNATFQIDLNKDGVNDFGLQLLPIFHSSMLLAIPDVEGNQVVRAAGSVSAAALNLGAPIGANRQFNSKTTYGGVFMAIAGRYGSLTWFRGPWAKAIDKYLGLKFLIDGQVHYGWARVSVPNWNVIGNIPTLTGYAYETVANQPLHAGQEKDTTASAWPQGTPEFSSLGMLARGADALPIWRREERAG